MMMMGFIQAWISPMTDMFLSDNSPVNLTLSEISWVMGAANLGAVLSPFPSAFLMDWLGRKHSLLILYCLPAGSWILVYFSTNFQQLFIARCISGLWVGVIMTVCPVYIGEIAEPKLRSFLCSFINLMLYCGTATVIALGTFGTYWDLAVVGLILSLVFCILLLIVPETPYYYCMTSKKNEGAAMLKWLKGEENVQEEFNNVMKFVESDLQRQEKMKDLFLNPGSFKAFITVIISTILFRAGGGNLALVLPAILPDKTVLCFTKEHAIVFLGAVLLFCSFRPKCLLRLGIRFLLISSSLLCGATMTVMILWAYLRDNSLDDVVNSKLYWVPFVSFLLFNSSYALGTAPVVIALKGEILPTGSKSNVSAIVTIVGNMTSFVLLKSFIIIREMIGDYFNYTIAASSSFALALFTHFYIIETEGKSLEQIQGELKTNCEKVTNKKEVVSKEIP